MAKISSYKSKSQLDQLRASEPLVGTDVSDEKAFGLTMSFYQASFSSSEKIDWLRVWLQENNHPEVIKVWWGNLVKDIRNKNLILLKFCAVARMKTRNITVPESENKKFQEAIQKILDYVKETDYSKRDAWEVKSQKKIPTEKQITSALDDIIERISDSGYAPVIKTSENILEYMDTFPIDSTINLSAENIKKVQTYYQMQLSCIEDDLAFAKSNPNEGIKFNPNTNAIVDYMKNILEACAIGIIKKNGGKVEPKKESEKKKVVTLSQTVKKANDTYQKHDKELNVTSITPDKVVGKKEVVMYDTHQRILKFVKAEEGKTLTFANTLMQNIDMKKSFEKKISKSEFIKELMTMSKTDIMKKYKEIKNTEYNLKSAYINKFTMFLKVY